MTSRSGRHLGNSRNRLAHHPTVVQQHLCWFDKKERERERGDLHKAERETGRETMDREGGGDV